MYSSALDVASHSGRSNPEKRAHGIHCIEGWVSHRTGLEAMEKTILPFGRPACSLVTILAELQRS
jgi:hypothetical protein